MIRLFYNLLWPVGLLLFLPGYLAKMFRRGGYRRNFGQRLGFYSAESRERLRGKHPTWIHAVSVGEIVIALKLADELRALRPDLKCVLTTTTTTGHALAEKTAPQWMQVLYAPLDFWPVMRRAFRVIAPQRNILIEAEVWPNLVAEARNREIPVVLANARLSPRSERRFRRFRFFVTPTFRQLDLVCVPSTDDAERWKNLGVAKPRIHAVGNIKYDASNPRHASGEVQRWIKNAIETTRPILFGGSTHRGEEKILIDVFCALQSEFPNLFLVLAPRHVERASEIEADLRNRNLRSIRRSAAGKGPEGSDCLLIDTTGELRDWYDIATIVFIGKSLTAHGGQNPVEAISARKPVIFGPHMENFASLAKGLIEAGGAACVQNSRELIQESRRLLRDATAREQLVANALRVIQPHREAAARSAALIEKISSMS
ncbi:MAG: 3-deoxy-D-manno-octulosonic acid transferase [Verrucomicrobia bacterium]|nr:MAG: 3-deoxy-D-manno-octulosonic acid transferase [Verrucomicrobiota bacterium]